MNSGIDKVYSEQQADFSLSMKFMIVVGTGPWRNVICLRRGPVQDPCDLLWTPRINRQT